MSLSSHFPPYQAVIEPIRLDLLEQHGVSLSILREDLSNPEYGGNKLRKLKYNILKAESQGLDTLLSFGGVWSNHIYALAAMSRELGFKSIGIIRGEDPRGSTATLDFARECGMDIHFISRGEYREKKEDFFKAWLRDQFGAFHLIPEGGSNFLGVNGCMEILGKHTRPFDVVAIACGTGATLAGLVLSMGPHQKALGFSAVGEGEHLTNEVTTQIGWTLGSEEAGMEYEHYFRIVSDYDFGGFARTSPELIASMRDFHAHTGIRLDPLYTGKMIFGLLDLVEKGRFVPGTRILAVHTGGMQGLTGIERKLGESIYPVTG